MLLKPLGHLSLEALGLNDLHFLRRSFRLRDSYLLHGASYKEGTYVAANRLTSMKQRKIPYCAGVVNVFGFTGIQDLKKIRPDVDRTFGQ